MKIQSPPGMRDFYPEQMRLQRWLFDLWHEVSRCFGYQEYDGPIFEYLDLYTIKSGEQIVSELFSFEDRGGRRFAIRPEMTPTLARMVAAKAHALPRPIKWYSIPRLCRAERPQRGRLREFFQWNLDILGVDDPLADAEIIAAACEFFRRAGLSEQDVLVRINSRDVAGGLLRQLGVPGEKIEPAFVLIDRLERIGEQAFAEQWRQQIGPQPQPEHVVETLTAGGLDRLRELAQQGSDEGFTEAVARLDRLFEYLEAFGVRGFCELDLRIVRGLAYYTGIVFEAHPRKHRLRALLGGGRYDDLTGLLDGPKVPGVGFGMGDVPVLELLNELGRTPELQEPLDAFVIDADTSLFVRVTTLVSILRRAGIRCDCSFRRAAVGKQFKQAAQRGARYAIVVGQELIDAGMLTVKDLRTGQQRQVSAEALRSDPHALLKPGAAGKG